MRQPIKEKRKPKPLTINITGIQYCNECPFLEQKNNQWFCSPNDYKLQENIDNKILVPDWCGSQLPPPEVGGLHPNKTQRGQVPIPIR